MGKTIISEGKTSTEAIEKGLKELGVSKNEVEIKVLEEEKKAFFSILAPRVVKVEMTVKEKEEKEKKKVIRERREPSKEDVVKCKEAVSKFLDDFGKAYGGITYEINEVNNDLKVIIKDEDGDNTKLIGFKGHTIDGVQNLLSVIGNKETKLRVRVSVDIGDFRKRQENILKEKARKGEAEVMETGRKVTLKSMPAYERKIIHTELQDSENVTTYSIGEEPNRRVVIVKK